MKNNYDPIAKVYDSWSRAVFGKAQVQAQLEVVRSIPPRSRVLLVGGGSGWILEELALLYPEGLDLVYVELSAKMMMRSKQRKLGALKVQFVEQAIETYPLSAQAFDIVFTPFLFDNFGAETALHVFLQLHRALNTGGLWLFVDFYTGHQKGRIWKKGLLALMYRFFRYVCGVEAKQLPDMEPLFEQQKYQATAVFFHYAGFIKGVVYKKNE